MNKEELLQYFNNKGYTFEGEEFIIYDVLDLLDNQYQKQLAELKAENEILKKYKTIYYLNQLQTSNEDINKFKQNELYQCINISNLFKDYTKQVRKEVCEEIIKFFDKNLRTCDEYDCCGFGGTDIKDIYKFLYQIQGGDNA